MANTLTPGEEAQLAQTIEMFEVITQSQPLDYQSLEILKEAYSKLGREKDVIATAKRIAQAYVQLGQLSSAILEYETILQRCPEDPDVQAALRQIESKANNLSAASPSDTSLLHKSASAADSSAAGPARAAVQAAAEDGRPQMHKLFVESKTITEGDFDLCWQKADLDSTPSEVVAPFIHTLATKAIVPVETSLKLLSNKARIAYLPLQHYEIDLELLRKFPAATCRRWCVMPFDKMSKSVLVATANPFNQQAAKELALATPLRVLWYLVPPEEILKTLQKAFR